MSDDAQRKALFEMSDEIMSALHAEQLKQDAVSSETVTKWLRLLYDTAQIGLGKPPQFDKQHPPDAT